jgi:hypothetical protein
MKNTLLLTVALSALISFPVNNRLAAAEITFFGDFEDGFGPAVFYDSEFPYEPGSFDLVFSELVVGISKFDPSLGTLTDITIFIDTTDPISYSFDGGISAAELDDGLDGFSADMLSFGDVGVNYESPDFALHPIIVDDFEVLGFCSGFPGEGFCGEAIDTTGDGEVDGSESVMGLVDPADFVGLGDVDSLFVQLFLEGTALFDLTNSTAVGEVFYDVFDGDSGADDAIVGVTYTFTPIPEPSSVLLTASMLALLGGMRRRT